ncbi:MAG TPA: tripartite tricarboxylate transporter substrate binding protein [Ramlibacter sp.]|nr:tripartite tricarboxylate transporter substrate binding protein [Ramlibacter sp.]
MNRRDLLAACAGTAMAGAAWAQGTYPTRPITLICPWPPGGGADVQLRMLAKLMSAQLGQNVVVENRPGATGSLGAVALMQAKPDGYTLAQSHNGVLRQPFIAPTPYDPLKDFTYIIGVSDNPFGLVVREDREWKTLEQFIEHARRNPGKVNIGVPGRGSPGHLVSDQIASQFDLKWTVVPYRGTANTMQALLAGEIDAAAESTGWVPFVEGNKARLLAVFSRQRFKKFPNVPTLVEQKIQAWDYSPWGIVAPAGLDPAIATRLHDAIRRVMDNPEFVNLLATLAQEPLYMSPQRYVEYVREAMPQQKVIVEKYNLKAT